MIGLVSLVFLILITGICYRNISVFYDASADTDGIQEPLLYIGNVSITRLALSSNVSSNEQNISIKKGQEFGLDLESNPTTGFEWIPEFDKNIINLTSHTFRPSSTLIGSGGTDNFTFKGVSQGTTNLKFQYKRSWDKDFAQEKVFLVNVT